MKITVIALTAFAIIALATTAYAQPNPVKPDWRVCEGNGSSLDVQLAACDALVRTVRGKRDLAYAYLNRGAARARMEQKEAALADYTMAIGLDPELPEAITDRAQLYRKMGKIELSNIDYKTVTQLHPHNAEEYLSRGVAFAQLGDFKAALMILTRS